MLKKISLIAVIAALLWILCACTPKIMVDNSNFRYDPENVDINMSGELTIWWAPMDYMAEPLQHAIERFNKIYKNIKINVREKVHAEYYDELNLSYLNNTTPDIVRLDHVYIQSLGESGLLVDLDAMTEGKVSEMEADKFLPATWEAMGIGDSVYGFPYDASITLLMYNDRICREVFGEDYQPPKNYEELKEQSIAVYNYENAEGVKPYKGFVMPLNAADYPYDVFLFNGWLERHGVSLLNDDRTACTVNTEAGIETYRKVKDMVTSGALQYIGYYPYLEESFTMSGETAFMEMGSWVYDSVKDMDMDNDGKCDIKVAMMPRMVDDIEPYSTLGVAGISVTSACKPENRPAAYEFVKFLTTDYESHMEMMTRMNVFPSLVDGFDDEYYTNGDEDWQEYWSVFKQQFMLGRPRPGTVHWPDIVTAIKKSQAQLLLGGAYTPEVVVEALSDKIDSILQS